ncbi:MAG: DHH family phosphoesterase [Filifactoraceae bacterium]
MKANVKLRRLCIVGLGIATLILLYYNKLIGVAFFCFELYICYISYVNKKRETREWTEYIEDLSMTMDNTTRKALTNLPIPLCVCKIDGSLNWYNKKFTELVNKKNLLGVRLNDIIDNFDIESLKSKVDSGVMYSNIGDSRYRIIFFIDSTKKVNVSDSIIMYFIDVTDFENLTKEFRLSRPAVLSIQVDSFDEVRSSTSEEDVPLLEVQIEKVIKLWAEENNAAFRRFSADRYFIVMTEEALIKNEKDKFEVLDHIRSIEQGNTIPVTISIGASSYDGNSIRSTQLASITALDLALGRGGDQAAIRRNERYIFFGGKSKAVEKRTRVKARIISHAMKDLISEASNVLVMGHTYPDLDSLGASMGVVGIAKMLNKEVNIVMCTPNKSIDTVYKKIMVSGGYKDLFVGKDEVMRKVKGDTLLIVVDTHKPSLTDMPKLVNMIDKIVLIDHHRRGVEFLDKAMLVYHETYVSSASEMVTELIQYIKDKPYIDPITSEVLLAGIMLDTKNFTFKAGARTFEAAAFLRKSGADMASIKTLFQGDASLYLLKAEAIKNVKILGEVIAISYLDSEGTEFKLAASQSADELLNIKGVQASFVLASDGEGNIQISARSLDKINVQVIMEKLDGGGHLNTAATQVTGINMEEAIEKVEDVVMEYMKEEGI